MKVISKYVIYWAISFFFLSLAFRFGLSTFLTSEQYNLILLIAILYGILIFSAGWIFGKAHGTKSLQFDLGITFNITGFLMFSLVSLTWFWAGLNAETESIKFVYLAMAIWGILLAIHVMIFLIARKDTIKGIHKSEIFD
jgi:hypothetical protein